MAVHLHWNRLGGITSVGRFPSGFQRLASDSLVLISNTLYLFDLIALGTFAVSYYRTCYRKSYRMDFWHLELLLLCVIPNMLMLPFAGSAPNALILGSDYRTVAAVIPRVFLVTLFGYVTFLAGGSLWRLHLGIGIRARVARALGLIPRCSMMLMSSGRLLIMQTFICLTFEIGLLTFNYANRGFNFDLRSLAFEKPALRPILQVTSFYSIIIASHCLARYLDRKEKSLLYCNLSLAAGLLLFGSRGGLLSIYLNLLVCVIMKRRRNVSLLRLGVIAAFILCFIFYLGNVRGGEYSPIAFATSIVFLLFYGNNFSDLRDFAWVYASWDHTLWLGKTYLAALTAFVPRFLSSFRDTWGMGAATAATVGFDPAVHPGLRPGAFGEGYFNFGFAGVLVVGLTMGIIVRRVDLDVKRILRSPNPSMMGAYAATMTLNLAITASISVNSSTLYVMAGVYVISWFCLQVVSLLRALGIIGSKRLSDSSAGALIT